VKSYSSLEDAMKGVAKQVNGLRDDSGNRTPQYEEMQRAIMDASEKLPMANGAVDYAALVEGGARMGVANSDDPWQKQKADLLAFASMAAKASVAFELPADQLSESLGKIAGLYKIPTQNIEQLGDAINYLDDNAKSKGSDIIDVLQRVGGLASQLDYKQAAALGSTFLTLGTPAEVAASATNAMVRELSIATVQAKTLCRVWTPSASVPKKSRRACQWTRWAQSFQCWKRPKTGPGSAGSQPYPDFRQRVRR
jgi:TP901 family phage tail tape measure protein